MNATARLSTRIGNACSQDSSRYALADAAMVRIPTKQNPDHAAALATDGHILAAVTGCSLTGAECAMIPAKAAKAAIKGTDRAARLLTVSVANGQAIVSGQACPLSDREPSNFPPAADVFPALDKEATDYAIVGVNVDLLAQLSDAIRAHGKTGHCRLVLQLERRGAGPATTRKPIVVIPTDENQPAEGSAIGCLMPLWLAETEGKALDALTDARRRAKIAIDAAKALAEKARQPARPAVDVTA